MHGPSVSSERGQSERRTEMEDEEQPEPKEWSSELQELRCVKESGQRSNQHTEEHCGVDQIQIIQDASVEIHGLHLHGELKPLDAQCLKSVADVESQIRLVQEQSDAAIRQLRDRQAELKLEAALGARLQLIEDMEAKLRDRDSQIEALEFALSASEQNRRVAETEIASRHKTLEARVASLEDDLERAQKQCAALQCEDLHLATTLAEVERRERALRAQNAQAMDRLSSRRMSIAVDEALAAQGLSRTQSMDVNSSITSVPFESSDKSKSDNQSCHSLDASLGKTSNQDIGNDKCKTCLTQVASCTVVPCGHKVLCLSCARQLLAVGPARCPRCHRDVETFLQDLPSPERSPIYRGWGVAHPS